MAGPVQLYDSTLRDGSQMEGISFSLEDKLLIVQKLDELGIDFVEGGFPGSNPKDAELFFDGYAEHPEYALQVVRTAARAGAEVVALCDTNGGMITPQLLRAVEAVRRTSVPFGIHVHDDAGLAVANTLAAFEAGAVQ